MPIGKNTLLITSAPNSITVTGTSTSVYVIAEYTNKGGTQTLAEYGTISGGSLSSSIQSTNNDFWDEPLVLNQPQIINCNMYFDLSSVPSGTYRLTVNYHGASDSTSVSIVNNSSGGGINNYKLNGNKLTSLKLNNIDVTKVTLNGNVVYENNEITVKPPVIHFNVTNQEDFDDFSRYYFDISIRNDNNFDVECWLSYDGSNYTSSPIFSNDEVVVMQVTWDDDTSSPSVSAYFRDQQGNESEEVTEYL